jgi:hypothetical protein
MSDKPMPEHTSVTYEVWTALDDNPIWRFTQVGWSSLTPARERAMHLNANHPANVPDHYTFTVVRAITSFEHVLEEDETPSSSSID